MYGKKKKYENKSERKHAQYEAAVRLSARKRTERERCKLSTRTRTAHAVLCV